MACGLLHPAQGAFLANWLWQDACLDTHTCWLLPALHQASPDTTASAVQDPRPQKYTLPDGQVFSITTEGVQLGEALLQPALMGVEDAELPEALVSQVQQHPDAGMRKVRSPLLTRFLQGHTRLFIRSLLQGACILSLRQVTNTLLRSECFPKPVPKQQTVFKVAPACFGTQHLGAGALPMPASGSHDTTPPSCCRSC